MNRSSMIGAILGICLALLPVAPARAAQVLHAPSAVVVYLLQEKFSSAAPDYDVMATFDPAVRAANEFKKDDATRHAVADLKKSAENLGSVTGVVVNLSATFSQYDPDAHEFEFDLGSDTFMTYSAFGREVHLVLTNGSAAQSWSLPPAEAEKILKRTNGSRYVILALTLELLPSPPATPNEPAQLNARIVSYDVLDQFGRTKLGSVTVAP